MDITKIYEEAETKSKTYLGQKRIINRLFHKHDQSELYPINSRFNATERAIRRINKLERCNGAMSPLEYIYAIDTEISTIINGEI